MGLSIKYSCGINAVNQRRKNHLKLPLQDAASAPQLLKTLTTSASPEDECHSECHSAGGQYAEGRCWFLGDRGDSCQSVCRDAGLPYDRATATYIGSERDGGTLDRCRTISRLFGGTHGARIHSTSGVFGRSGCTQYIGTRTFWWARGPTTSGAKFRYLSRLCACRLQGLCGAAGAHDQPQDTCEAAGGREVNDRCWLKGELGASCIEACAAVGTNDLEAGWRPLRTYVDAFANLALCGEISAAFGDGDGEEPHISTANAIKHLRCAYNNENHRVYYFVSETRLDGSAPNMRRYCACQSAAD